MSIKQRLICVPLMMALVLTGGLVFAEGQEEEATAERVSIGFMYRGWDPTAWDMDMVENDRIWNYIEDKFNVDLTIEYGGSGDIIVATMAAGTAPDIVMMWPGHPWLGIPTWQSWIQDGLLTNMNDLVSAEPDLSLIHI